MLNVRKALCCAGHCRGFRAEKRHWSQTAEVSDFDAVFEQASEVQRDTRTNISKHASFVLDDTGITAFPHCTHYLFCGFIQKYVYIYLITLTLFSPVRKASGKVKGHILHVVSFKHLCNKTQSILF